MTAILIVAGFGILALLAGAYVVGSWAGYDDGYDAGLADKKEFGGDGPLHTGGYTGTEQANFFGDGKP